MKKAFNASLFVNNKDDVKFSKSKDEKVRADYNGNGSDKDGMSKVQIVGIKAVSSAGKDFIRLTFIDRSEENKTTYYNGALFPNDKKEKDSHPHFTGSLDLDREGNNRLRLAAWVKPMKEEGKRYLSIAVSEYQVKDEAAAENVAAAAPAAAEKEDFPF